ncbi:MAG: hypothetical protein EOP36_06145 [Rubrivivax sp.]|nr:MAG: hypothetical protein EOP36_06145 [Rubrivivax sp.]
MTKAARACIALWACLLLATGLAGCGGGDNSHAGVGSGGTGSFSDGRITGFGSIVVNGIHFDQTTAVVIDADQQPRTAAELKLGMVVQLKGSPITTQGGRQVANASVIQLSSELLGPVDALGTAGLTVMGQTVLVNSGTYFSDDLPLGLSSLVAADLVEVYGFHDATNDTYVATRIEKRDPLLVQHYVVKGVLKNLNLGTGYCSIGAQTLAYAWQNPPAGLANGRVARALIPVSTAPVGGTWTAQSMSLNAPLVAQRDQASIDGLVTDLTVGNHRLFSVNGIAVDATTGPCAVCATLHLGDHLQVKGRLVDSVLVASEVNLSN